MAHLVAKSTKLQLTRLCFSYLLPAWVQVYTHLESVLVAMSYTSESQDVLASVGAPPWPMPGGGREGRDPRRAYMSETAMHPQTSKDLCLLARQVLGALHVEAAVRTAEGSIHSCLGCLNIAATRSAS